MSSLFFTVCLRCRGIEYVVIVRGTYGWDSLLPAGLALALDYKEDASKGSEACIKPCSADFSLL